MDRLFHLEQVFMNNLAAASDFPEVEFVLLNYGSKDGLDGWASKNLGDHIKEGKVIYLKTDEPEYWSAAHAKNIAHKMASGDILCNLDSDVSIPNGFCEYISSLFEDPSIIVAFDSEDELGNNGCAGMIVSRKEHFHSVNGYDESIRMGWGWDDTNFQFRCRMRNSLRLFVPPKICRCISHSNEIRTANCRVKDIDATMRFSVGLCEKSAAEGDYVANKGIHWGKAKIFKNFSTEPTYI